MKPLKTKAQIRAEIEQQVEAYLQRGGAVHDVPSGISGHANNENPFGSMMHSGPPQSRTPLVEVVRQIDARKARPKAPAASRKPRKPRRILITDDFGEPVRWVWEE